MTELPFLPFGAQYYRAPTPLRQDHRRDLTNFAAQGFNTIKIWAQWRWNEPAPGEYDFSDLRELLDIAEENGLHVVVNIICDTAPAWFFRQYPESVMRLPDGRPVTPQTTPCRQIGGAPGPCYHHPEGIAARRAFIEAAARELGDHPALFCWDLWNEPELTCGIHRQPELDEMVCYCENSRAAFIEWLRARYGGIEGVNAAWGRNYRTFDELELPRCAWTLQDMVDWRAFFAETLAEELGMRADAVRRFDPRHPVMVHTVPMPYFNMVNACADEYLLAQKVDIFGNSVGSFPFSATTATSAAGSRPVLNAEIHALGGSTFDRPSVPTFEEMKRHILIPLGRGVMGFLFWQYRPERMGTEAPAWGLTDMQGNETPWLRQAQQINAGLQAHAPRLLRAKRAPARVAVLSSGEDQVFTWCVSSQTDWYYQCVKGLFDMLYDGGYPVDIISEHQLTAEGLAPYACVVAPFPYYLRGAQADALRQWVADGGYLISEALFGAYTAETNLHAVTVPGYGFDEVFGVSEGSVISASGFRNAYGSTWAERDVADEVAIDYPGGTAYGHHFREHLICGTAEEVGRFADGTAVTVNAYGRGQAALIGSLIGRTYAVRRDAGTAGLLYHLLARCPAVQPLATGGRHTDLLFIDGRAAFAVVQATEEGRETTVCSPTLAGLTQAENIMDGRTYPVADGRVTVDLAPGGIDAFAFT